MTPYDGFGYFVFLLYVLVPVLALGLAGRLRPWSIVAVGAAVLALQFADPLGSAAAQASGLRQLTFCAAYVLWSLLVIRGFQAVRSGGANRRAYWAALGLALLPLAAVKVAPLLGAHLAATHLAATHLAATHLAAAHLAATHLAATHLAAAHLAATHLAATHLAATHLAATHLAATHLAATHLAAARAAARRASGRTPAPLLPAGLIDAFGFLGISYITFRVLDVLILIQDGVLGAVPATGELLAYLTFFPTFSAGPIDRYHRFVADLRAGPRGRAAYAADVEAGIHRIAQGFLYKFVFAYLVYRYALTPAAAAPGAAGDLAYMYAYSLYLFFDFAGYSAFAIGVGRFLGVRVPENFAGPFLSPNFREMWNRWNMTLSFWFRDHVYMRFALGATRRRWFHGNRHAVGYAGFMVTMGLMGLWHGLAANYIVYGLYQGVMLVAYDFLGRWNRRRRVLVLPPAAAKALGIFVTVNLFCFGLLVFSGHLFR